MSSTHGVLGRNEGEIHDVIRPCQRLWYQQYPGVAGKNEDSNCCMPRLGNRGRSCPEDVPESKEARTKSRLAIRLTGWCSNLVQAMSWGYWHERMAESVIWLQDSRSCPVQLRSWSYMEEGTTDLVVCLVDKACCLAGRCPRFVRQVEKEGSKWCYN